MQSVNNQSIFSAVSALNVAYGNPKGDPKNPNWEKLESQAKNIKDEYDELMEAIEARDITGVRDAICDILVFTLGEGHIAGVDVDADMRAVDESNRSKFCRDINELETTLKKYNALGVQVYAEGDYPFVRVKSTETQTGNDGKSYPKGKMLKGPGFKEPVFYSIQ